MTIETPDIDGTNPDAPLMLSVGEDESSGHWITSDGEHIYISGGVVTKGPAHLMGKTTGEAHEWHAKQRDAEAKNSRRQVDYHMKRGEKDQAEKHAHIAKFHEDKAKELRGHAKEHGTANLEKTPDQEREAKRSLDKKTDNFFERWSTQDNGEEASKAFNESKSSADAWANGKNSPDAEVLDKLHGESQSKLNASGTKSIKTYRGFELPHDHPIAQAIKSGNVKVGDEVDLGSTGVASYSGNKKSAERFSSPHAGKIGFVVEHELPASRVISGERFHPAGFLDGEDEILAKGSANTMVKIHAINDDHGLLKESPASEPAKPIPVEAKRSYQGTKPAFGEDAAADAHDTQLMRDQYAKLSDNKLKRFAQSHYQFARKQQAKSSVAESGVLLHELKKRGIAMKYTDENGNPSDEGFFGHQKQLPPPTESSPSSGANAADHTASVEKHVTSHLVGGASTKKDFRNSAQFGADKKSYTPDVEHSLRQSVAAGHIEAIPREQYPGDNPANDHKLINIGGKAIRDFRLTSKGRDALESAGHKLSGEPEWETIGTIKGDEVQVRPDADKDTRAAAMNGHGSVYGSCGHKMGGCRCGHSNIRHLASRPCADCKSKSLAAEQHSFATTHIELPKAIASKIKEIANAIPDQDLAEDGRETNPHITVKYGLHRSTAYGLRGMLNDEMPSRFRMGNLKVFPSTPDRQSDVVVAAVDSPDLHRLNAKVSESVPHTTTFPDYMPHATVAYLKPGMGQKYAGWDDLDGMEGTADEIVHSDREGNETRIPLRARARISADAEHYEFISLESAELTGGTWKTINGARVYIKDGVAIAGPNHLVGKNETEVGNHGAEPAKRQGFHPIQRDAMGNYQGENQEHAERLKSLKLAPGYTHVHLAEDPKAALQAVVKDSKGRDQYKYSAEHSGKASSAKWDRAKRFAQDVPAIKKKLDADKSEEGAALRLIHATGLRIGGTADTGAAEQAYGATTLESHHVSPNASGGATLKFVGKKGVSITHDVSDPDVAKEVLERAKSGGKLYNTTDAKTRDLLHKIAPGTDYKVKDFRTHAAAVTARNAMKSLPAPTDEKSLAAGQKKVAEAVAAKLGNTPAVAIKDYIPPETFAPWHAKVGNLQQAGLIQKFATAKGITPDAAGPEWIGKHAASFREDYKTRHAVTGKAGKLNEAAYLSSEQDHDDANRSEQVQDRSGNARDDRRDVLRSTADGGGGRGSGGGSREDRPRRRIEFDAVALDAGDLPAANEIPGALEGLPTFEEIPDEDKIEGEDEKGNPIFAKKRVPIQYYRKEVLRAAADGKKWTHRGLSQLHGEVTEFPLTIQDLDETVRNFHELDKAGIHPFIPDRHVDRQDAAANNGKIIALERKGNGLFAKMKVVGTKGNEKILNNDVSVHLVNGNSKLIVDAYGKPYKGWVLHHVALTPNPNQPHLQPFEKIAASADEPEQDVPVFRYSAISTAAPSRRRPKMTPQLAAQARQALGITASVEEEQFDDIVGQKAIALSADFATIKQERDTLRVERDQIKQERDAAKADAEAKSLALSAEDPTKRDPMSISLITRAFRTDREQVIASGVVSEAGMKEIDAMMFGGDGKPTRTALALSAGSTDPLYSRLCEILRRNPGIKVQNGAPRDATAAIPPLSADDPKADAVQANLLAEARKALGTKGAAA